jgi:hypothetical protein
VSTLPNLSIGILSRGNVSSGIFLPTLVAEAGKEPTKKTKQKKQKKLFISITSPQLSMFKLVTKVSSVLIQLGSSSPNCTSLIVIVFFGDSNFYELNIKHELDIKLELVHRNKPSSILPYTIKLVLKRINLKSVIFQNRYFLIEKYSVLNDNKRLTKNKNYKIQS